MSKGRRPSGGGQRPRRVGEQIRQVLGELTLSGDVRAAEETEADIVSFTEVRLTADLRSARVFVSIFPSDPAVVSAVMEALERDRARIRARVGQEIRLRHTPELVFQYDGSIEHGARIHALLEEVRAEDEALGEAGPAEDPSPSAEES